MKTLGAMIVLAMFSSQWLWYVSFDFFVGSVSAEMVDSLLGFKNRVPNQPLKAKLLALSVVSKKYHKEVARW